MFRGYAVVNWRLNHSVSLKPLSSRNILRDSLDKILVKIGSKQDGLAFHSFADSA
jgi:hypothetical protein